MKTKGPDSCSGIISVILFYGDKREELPFIAQLSCSLLDPSPNTLLLLVHLPLPDASQFQIIS